MTPAGSKNAPEARARETIDALLAEAGWLVQDREDMNLTAAEGIAVREFKLEKGHGYVDYLLFVDGNALGVVEAKPAGYSFTSALSGLRLQLWKQHFSCSMHVLISASLTFTR